MEKSEKIQELLNSLPDNPGVYQFYDAQALLLYIGKAKNLKKRVGSYFNRDVHDNNKTSVLVKKICDIKFIIVDTELDALLLENSLIKNHQPRYNVLLKDDKTYPWICIKNERFPRVFSTRTFVKDGSAYFGPYASGRTMHILLDLVHKLYPLRNCNFNLSAENIEKKKFKICLEYHIGNCKGPCENLQSEEEYNANIALIKNIIKGNISSVIKEMKSLMLSYSEKTEFEKAQLIKEKIGLLLNYQSKSTVVSPDIENADVFSIVSDEKTAYVNYLRVINGAIIQGHTIELKKKLEETPEELLTLAIAELRSRFDSNAKEIIVPFAPELQFGGAQYTVPQRGDKRHLLELSEKNVGYYRKEKERQQSLVDPERHTRRIMQQMMKDLRLKSEPRLIECFDNSNIQGSYPVAAMTVFIDGKPAKKQYRHFNIKTVEGPDDFASMEEVIYRRYKRVLEGNLPLPDLIVIDGGKGQLSSALKSLENLGLTGKVGIIGIAKKLEEIYYPGDSLPLYLDKKSETLRIIQQIRDEAHRFGITHHRKKREKGTIKTELTEIPGVSDLTARKLLEKFKSVKQIKSKTLEEISEVVGPSKAQQILSHLARLLFSFLFFFLTISKALAQTDSLAIDANTTEGIHQDSLKNYKEAIKYYSKATKANTENANAWLYKATDRYLLGQNKSALEDLAMAIKVKPDFSLAFSKKGLIEAAGGDFKSALADLDKALSLNGENLEALVQRGIIKNKMKKHKEAIDDFNVALDIKPSCAEAWIYRAKSHNDIGDYQMAMIDFSKAIHLDSTHYELFKFRGNTEFQIQDFKSALEDYNKAVEMNDKDPEVYTNRAATRINLRDNKGAVEDCNKALSTDANNPKIYNFRGTAKSGLKDYRGAIEDLDKAIKLKPSFSAAYINRAAVHFAMGDKKGACADLVSADSLGNDLANDLIDKYCNIKQK